MPRPRQFQMNGRQRVFFLIGIMSVIALSVTVTSIVALYNAALDQQSERMREAAEGYATLVRASARLAGGEQDIYGIAETLSDTFAGATTHDHSHSDFVLAERVGDNIHFLLVHELDRRAEIADGRVDLEIPMNSDIAEPMDRALNGEAGTVIGLDLWGEEVLAGFAPVEELGLGVVVKIGLQDLRRPYIQTAVLATVISSILIVFGVGLFHRIGMSLVVRAEESDVRHRSVLDTTSEGYWRVDAAGKTVEVNRALCRMLGYDPEDIIGHPPAAFADQDSEDALEVYMSDSGADAGVAEVVLRPKSGHAIHARVSASPLTRKNGDTAGAFAFVSDISDQKRTEFELRYLSQAVEQSPASVIITNTDGHIQYVNSKFTDMTGYEPDEVIGMSTRLLSSGFSSPKVHEELWDTIKAGEIWRGELHDRRKNGEFFWVETAITPIRDDTGDITHYLAIQEDVTIRKKYEEELVQQANYDKLTGLPNRLLGADRLDKALQHSKRLNNNAALLFLDLDGFKKINDSLGHATGDRLLQETAQRLSHCVRASDTVARWGGDEFLIVLPDLATPESAELVAEKVLEVCSAPYHLDGYELSVTASIGISVYPLDGQDGTELMRNADAAMYAAKESGRDRLRFFKPELNQRAVERLALESDLRRALANHEFDLHYQPVVRIDTGDIIGAEALLRWHHPKTGPIPPDKFIPVAEDTGLIVPIGNWVIRTACEQAAQWRADGLGDLGMAINVSARQVSDARFIPSVTQVLRDTGVDPSWLDFEITERLLMSNASATRIALAELNALGVGLSIDDFGTGYSALGYLRQFSFDILKIDRTFVDRVADDKDSASLTIAIIRMAQSLGLKVIAEGVEGEAQLDFLRKHKCDLAQGYYFSRPLPASEFRALLASASPDTRPRKITRPELADA